MEKAYFLKGLDCPNCAAKIENAVKTLDGVTHASVNFMTTTLNLEVEKKYAAAITELVKQTVVKYEPDVIVQETNDEDSHKHAHAHKTGKAQIIRLAIGAVVFCGGIIFNQFMELDFYIRLIVFVIAYLILGGDVLIKALKNIVRGQVFDENFLMVTATIGAFAIGDFPEAVAVMLFYQVGEYFQSSAVRRSKKSISDMMEIRPDSAIVKRDGNLIKVSPETVEIDEIIVVKPGEKVPLDGIVIDGKSMLDTKALTGESLPKNVTVGDEVLSGCINQNGVLTLRVTKVFGDSTVAKIINLVENASAKKASTENFITKFSRYYTPVVVIFAILLSIIPPLFLNGDWSEWVNRGLIFLVISCPCALVISIPLGFFGGIGGASKRGILVKGGNMLEALANLDLVVFDKTGTLTKGVFAVTKVISANEFSENDVIESAANVESLSNHPIARSVMETFGKTIDKSEISDYEEISGFGISVRKNNRLMLAGNDKIMERFNIKFTKNNEIGTKIYVASDNQFMGCIVIADQIKKDSRITIEGLKKRGIRRTFMLTGDNFEIAENVAKELGIDEVFAELLPDQKVEKLEAVDREKDIKKKLAFVGDGINDAPVLAMADIGIAMGSLGSDAAIEAADVVLMNDEPSRILDAIDIAKFTKRIVWQNIVFAIGIKLLFLMLGALGFATMWEAVFADVGVSVIAILNAMRILNKSKLISK